jgi:hypothetical protein
VARQGKVGWNDAFWYAAQAMHGGSMSSYKEEQDRAMAALDNAMCTVLERHGINPHAMLAAPDQPDRKALPQMSLLDEAA